VEALAGLLMLGEMLDARQWLAIACVIGAGAGSVLGSGGEDAVHALPDDPL
jgi:inner membrane transporter RhtA